MDFLQTIQSNIYTALLFWSLFCISILISKLYQYQRLESDSNGNMVIKKMTKMQKNIWTILIVLLPSLLIGFRSVDVGADTMNLVRGYSRLAYQNNPIILEDRILYSILSYGSFLLSNGNATFFLFATAFLTLFILVKALDKWIDQISIPFALFVYYALFGMQLLNQSRQLIALSIFLYAIPYLIERKHIQYFWFILIASLFHFTASIGIIFWFFNFKKSYYAPIKKGMFYMVLLLSPILLYPFLSLANRILPSSYRSYIEIATYEGVGFGLLVTIFPIILPIFIYRAYIVNHASQYLARIALLTYPLRFAGYYSYFLMRLNYFSSVLMVLVIPIILEEINTKSKKRLTTSFMILILITYYVIHYMYFDAGGMFPYKSILSDF